MKIWLSGHRGFIGGHLYGKLNSLGHEVDTDLRLLDIVKYDAVIHLAATTHIRSDFDPLIFENNILLSKKVLSTPYRTIYASSCSAAHLTNPYSYTKRYCEWLGDKHGNAIGLRLHNVYGPGNNKGIVWYLMNQPDGAKFTIRGPELIRDYIYVDDVVNEIINVIPEHKTKLFNVARCRGPKCTPIMRERIIGVNKGVQDVGTRLGTATRSIVELFEEISGKKFGITYVQAGANEPYSMVSNYPVISVALRDGLKETISKSV